MANGRESARESTAVSSPTEPAPTDVKWFDESPGARLTTDICSFFASYCNLTERDELEKHLRSMRLRAWKIRSFPCIGQWGFLQPKIASSPALPEILTRLKAGDSILDFGCCLGQDLRWLAASGAPTDRMYGVDLHNEFWDIGFDLYRDRDRFKAQFICADIFDQTSALAQLRGCFEIVYMGSVLHLWNWSGQVKALKEIVKLTRPGSLLVACQIGRIQGQEDRTAWKNNPRLNVFFHDPHTVNELWAQVAAETATKWDVTAKSVDVRILLPEQRDSVWMGSDARMIIFEARRGSPCQL